MRGKRDNTAEAVSITRHPGWIAWGTYKRGLRTNKPTTSTLLSICAFTQRNHVELQACSNYTLAWRNLRIPRSTTDWKRKPGSCYRRRLFLQWPQPGSTDGMEQLECTMPTTSESRLAHAYTFILGFSLRCKRGIIARHGPRHG
jgi:hypothetical protein